MTDAHIDINGERLQLMPERTAYWPRTRTLFAADVHLGKDATFRASGVPIPAGETRADLNRLTQAIGRTGATKLIVLGDLVHARAGRTPRMTEQVVAWRATHPGLKLILVRGNHDRHAGDPPPEWRVITVDGPTPGPTFVLQHEPEPTPREGAYALAGHLHPATRLRGRGRQTLKLPCFWFRDRVGVLPAFARFTGGSVVQTQSRDAVFAITDQSVIKITAKVRD
ncbi:MAG: ligase-associated DNA damage response endonuclease PdeM [Chloroflexota bacterium]